MRSFSEIHWSVANYSIHSSIHFPSHLSYSIGLRGAEPIPAFWTTSMILYWKQTKQCSSANITHLDIKKICYICANCVSGWISPGDHRLHAQTGRGVDRMCKRCNHIFVEPYRTSNIKSSKNPPGNETGTQLSKFNLELNSWAGMHVDIVGWLQIRAPHHIILPPTEI